MTARSGWRYCVERRLVGLAAESAFWLSLALIPIAAVSGMLAARVALASPVSLAALLDSVPPEGRAWLANEVAQVASNDGGRSAPIAVAVLLWLASNGVHGICDVFEAATRCRERTWWRKRAVSVAACVALACGMGVLALLATRLGLTRAGRVGLGQPLTNPLSSSVQFGLSLVVDFAITVGLYRVGVARTERRGSLFSGALVAVALHAMVGFAYAAMIAALGDSSAYLAGLAVAGVTMTAMFLYTLSLLVGVAVNDTVGARRRRVAIVRRSAEASCILARDVGEL